MFQAVTACQVCKSGHRILNEHWQGFITRAVFFYFTMQETDILFPCLKKLMATPGQSNVRTKGERMIQEISAFFNAEKSLSKAQHDV